MYVDINNMENKLAFVAMIISFISLSVSIYLAWRDRANLKTHSQIYRHHETNESSALYVKAVNTGRRPITLRYMIGCYEEKSESFWEMEDGAVLLEEGCFYEDKIGKFDGEMINIGIHGNETLMLEDLFFEDTTGKRHSIKDAKHNIAKLLDSKHPLNIRTHIP